MVAQGTVAVQGMAGGVDVFYHEMGVGAGGYVLLDRLLMVMATAAVVMMLVFMFVFMLVLMFVLVHNPSLLYCQTTKSFYD